MQLLLAHNSPAQTRTTQNIVIGARRFAIPALVEAAAASGAVVWVLVRSACDALDTGPFLALALLLAEDYRSVGISDVAGDQMPPTPTGRSGHYPEATALISASDAALPTGGLLYGLLACCHQFQVLQDVTLLGPSPEDPMGRQRVVRWSILYLFASACCLLMARLPGANVSAAELNCCGCLPVPACCSALTPGVAHSPAVLHPFLDLNEPSA